MFCDKRAAVICDQHITELSKIRDGILIRQNADVSEIAAVYLIPGSRGQIKDLFVGKVIVQLI